MKDNIAVKVDDVHKEFFLPHSKEYLLKHKIVNSLKKKRKGGEVQRALRGISFEVEKGDFFGVVGRNGSGKSTLLKIISEIYQPTKGKVTRNGRLVPFIELGVGFNQELTGRENVYLNGAMLGFSRKEITEMYTSIVEFAELEDFMDQKLKNYSSGMKVRLGFSIAIRANADILVLDEVLAVGDAAFQRKCNDYFQTLKDNKKTIILVTHNMSAVEKYCTKAILIEEGLIKSKGDPELVSDNYRELFMPITRDEGNTEDYRQDSINKDVPTITARIMGKRVYTNNESIVVEVSYRNIDDREVYPKVIVYYKKVAIMGCNAKVLHKLTTKDNKTHIFRYTLPLNIFNQGEASIKVVLVDARKEIALTHYGYGNELPFIIQNPKTGKKIDAIINDVGSLEIIK